MANLYQVWDKEVQALESIKATPEQIEERRAALADYYEQKAKESGAMSKDIYAVLDKFNVYSRQKTSRFDDGLTPDEREMAQRAKDGTEHIGAAIQVAKSIKDVGIAGLSGLTRFGADIAQTVADVGDNNNGISGAIARAGYNATEDLRNNYSDISKQQRKDFWSPAGLAFGLSENAGQLVGGGALIGGALKGAKLLGVTSKGAQLATVAGASLPVAYGQGYGQGKESALDAIKKTSNKDLYANVVAEAEQWSNSGKQGDAPYLVEMYQEAGGDLDKMKDLMAENAGNLTGLVTAATAPIAMGAGGLIGRRVAQEAGESGGLVARNILRTSGARDAAELQSRLAARGAATGLSGKFAANAAIASQVGKMGGKQAGLQGGEEFIQEGSEGLISATEGSYAAGRKGDLTTDEWKDAGMQGLQGAVLGAVMGGGGALVTARDVQNGFNGTTPKKALPKAHEDAYAAFDQAQQAFTQAQEAAQANPDDVDAQEALAEADINVKKAQNQFEQVDEQFKAAFTPEEQEDLKSPTMKGVAARAKLAQEAKDAELLQQQQVLKEQEAAAKAQRDVLVNDLALLADDDVALNNAVAQLNLDQVQEDSLLNDVYSVKKANNKAAKKQGTQPTQDNSVQKTPLEMAVDAHFDASGKRNPKIMASDIANAYKVNLTELLPAIAQRIKDNEAKKQEAQAAAELKKRQAAIDASTKQREAQQAKELATGAKADQKTFEDTLADFAANNDADSLLAMVEDYNDADAKKLIDNAYKTAQARQKEAEAQVVAKKTAETKAEKDKQAQIEASNKRKSLVSELSALRQNNPNAGLAEWKAVGKKYGITDALSLTRAWSEASKTEQKTPDIKTNTQPLALPTPQTVMVADAQGNITPTRTEKEISKNTRNPELSVPKNLKVDTSNAANTQTDRGIGSYSGEALGKLIVRTDGKPFPTEQVAQQALENKASKPRKPKEKPVTPETHEVVPVEGGYAIAPIEPVKTEQPKKPDDDQDGGVVAETPTPKTPVSPSGQEGTIEGEYTHTQYPDAKATVNKTDKGYDVDFGDGDVQSFIGKTALDKTQALLTKEGFSKGNVAPETAQAAPETTPKTTGEQIAGAMDKTAQAITEAAHSKVVERVKSGEEVVYKQPAAIERVKQDERYQVEINDKGHAVVKNIKDLNGEWVKKDEPVVTKDIKQPKPQNKSVNTENDDLLVAIAKLGGINKDEAISKFGIDPAETNIRKAGLLPVFRKNGGLSFDDMAKTLYGYGYPVSDNGQYSPNALYDALDESLRGREVGTREYHEKRMEQRYAERMKEEAEFEDKLSQAGSSTWDEAENMESVVDAIAAEIINNESAINKDQIATTTKEVENVSDSTSSRQDNDTTAKTQSVKNGDTEVTGLGKAGQQESKGSTGKDTQPQGIQGLQGLTLTAQTEESRRKEEEQAKAAEAKRQAEEKAAKDKAQADKEVNDFRLSGSNSPADVAASYGQNDMFVQTRGQQAEKPVTEFDIFTKYKNEIATDIVKEIERVNKVKDDARRQGRRSKAEPNRAKVAEKYGLSAKGWGVFDKMFGSAIYEDIKHAFSLGDKKATSNEIHKAAIVFIDDWLAKNNIKIDEQSNEQNSINRKTENLAPAEKAQQVKKEPQKAEQPKQDKPIKKTPIQGKDIWMEVEFIAGNKSKELFYHNRMTDPNKPFNTEAEAIADWESKTEEQSKEQSNSTIEETKKPTKKERLLIQIDDELDAALDDLAAIFKEQGKRLSSGVDPVILGNVLVFGAKISALYIAKGAVKFAVWADNMISGLSAKGVPQSVVEPYLKQLYLASKVEASKEIRQQMDKEDDVYDFDFATLNTDQEETADSTEKTPTTKQTLTDLFYDHLKKGTLPENNVALRKMVAEFDGKEVDNYRLKEAQEMLEAAIARHSRDVVVSNHNGDASTFNQLVDAYNKQPNLNIRTSTSIENQAYSTPAPLAFVAAKMANIGKYTKVYEPTAGNGMLLITALPENATVNEMEGTRFNNLKAQGFNAHQGDALKAIENGVVKPASQDAIITNPPFGSIKENGKTVKVEVDGYKIGKIDHLIAAEALKAMKPNGTAAIIIGADMVQGGISTDDRIFFNWLYANYNVVGHFEVDGKLYSRQGASWPVRVIIVHGKQASNKNSPIKGAIPRYDNWKDVYDQYIEMVVASNNRGLSSDTSGTDNAANDTRTPQNVDGVETTQTGARGRDTTRNNDDVDGASTRNVSNRSGDRGKQLPSSDNVQRFDERTNAQDNLVAGDNRDTGGATRDNSGVDRRSKPDVNNRKDVEVLSDADNSFQVKYTPASSRKDEGVLIPINMRQPLMDSLLTLEDNVGDIDKYAAKELGYRNVDKLHDALMGLQVDSVASAIYQIKEKNKGIIIADQTGIGKGRQAAAIIRWAILNKYTPVFVTVKPQLFTDMYGDLSDIGSNDVKPFIVNTGESISGKDGQKLHKTKPDAKHRKEVETIANDGVLPDDYNAVFITYSQINKANNQQKLLSALSDNAIFILDESHNAGGASSTGMFVQEILKEAKGVVYLSATFAKRPDNMPLYFKTDMGMAVGDTNELNTAVLQGGLPLQTVISNALVKAGQLFRRERSYNGVSIETKVDSANKVEHEKLSDEATKALRAIVAADKMFHGRYFAQLEKAVEEQGKQAKAAGNKASQSVNHHEFSSVVHNFIRQMLLGLKVDTAANEAIAALKRGEKPLIALENTMGSFLNEYVAANGLKEGDSLGDFGYRDVLSRALHRTRAVTIKDEKGNETRKEVGLDELDSETRAAYNAAQKIIDSLDISIPASPIDWMRNRIEKAGYTVAEITGRNAAVDYSTNTPTVSQVPLSEQNDKVGTTRMFNSGELDVIILNVAGSTGISLHASEKFKDQRVRHMIVAQPAQDINIFMQMLGRIHRTGQVVLPKYTILTLDLPTEKRPTAVLNKKMKSLNANTSSNTESATSIVSMDMLNKYGDKVVAAYLSENQDIAKKISMEVRGDTSSTETHDDFAKKATGRFALLPIQEQNKIYDEIEPQYAALISYLDETGQNELEPKTIDFEAELKLESTAVPATDPSTPFGQEAIYGEYKVKPQGKPMTIDEVKALITKNIGDGVMPAQHTQKLIVDGQNAFDSFITTLEEKYQEAKDDEDAGNIQKNIVNQRAVFENTKSFIQSHRVGSIWQIDIKGDIYNAVITNIKSTFKKGGSGNPFAQSKIIISLAVNGELRSITVPLTEFSRIEVTKYYGSAEDALKQRGDDSALAKIITGNLLAAYANLTGSDGRVISFTKKDGSVEQGILLPKKFDFKTNIRQDFAIKNANDVFTLLKSYVTDIRKTGVASRKGDIRVVYNSNTGGIIIYTPKAKTTGGKWFLDKKIIGITGDFVSNGNMMVVNVPEKKSVETLSAIINKSPLYVLPSQADETKELLGYYDGQVNLKDTNKDTPKFSQSSTIGDQTVTQVRDKLISRFGKRIIDLLESKGILKIHQSMKTLPKGVLDMARGTEDAAYYNGVVHLIADNLTDETIIPAFMHDLSGHKGFQEMMSPKAYELIMQQFYRLVAQGNAIAIKAKQRAERAEVLTDKEKEGKTDKQIKELEAMYEARQQNEYIPYLLTEQVTAQEATPQERNAVKRLIDHILRAVKGWLFRTLSKYNTTIGLGKRVADLLDERDIQLMAERMIKDIAKRGGDNNNSPKFSKTEQSQFDQLLAKADKMIAEQGKLLAPNGKPSKLNRYQWAQVRTDNFKAWFGDWENDPANASKVVDENGEPMVVYHGTEGDFNEFKPTKPNFYAITEGTYFFTDNENVAANFGKYVMPVYLNIDNPTELDGRNAGRFNTWELNDDSGNYGWIVENADTGGGFATEYAVENPTQIKSAIGNTGDFNPTNPDIRFSRGQKSLKDSAKDILPDYVKNSLFDPPTREGMAEITKEATVGWWSRTIGTQLNLAKKNPAFKKVFDLAQRYLQHVSSDAVDAVAVAPNLLSQLETKDDLVKLIGQTFNYRRIAKDREAVANVIFDETLKGKKLLTEQELAEKLTPDQVNIYKEARAAIEVSLKNLAKSEMTRKLLMFDVVNWQTIEDLIKKNMPIEAFAEALRENVQTRISNFTEELNEAKSLVRITKRALKDTSLSKKEARQLGYQLDREQAAVDKIQAQIAVASDAFDTTIAIEEKLQTLLDEGYAPLMRFGEHTLTVRDREGKTIAFMMFEGMRGKAERQRLVNYLATEMGNTVSITLGTISKKEHKLYKGMTPESLALFAKETGMDKDAAYQEWLKNAVPARSAMTRMIHRKGTAGFSYDIQRVVSHFVMSNARLSAKNIYYAKINESIADIKDSKAVKDQALTMAENVFDPTETFAGIRNILFLWNLGGSFMFGFLNMTQPWLQTAPMLAMHLKGIDGARQAYAMMGRGVATAFKTMLSNQIPDKYKALYDRAKHEGHVDPQNVFMLSGMERGKAGVSNNLATIGSHLLGSIAALTESLNRRAVFFASLELANKKGEAWVKSKGFESAYDFAVDVIDQTQGIYNKGNRSNWANSPIGAIPMTFKQYGVNYVEQMVRMYKAKGEGEEGKKAVMLMLLMLASLAGGLGLPFVKDVLDISETIAAFLGKPVNIEREIRMSLGRDLADPLLNGWTNTYIFNKLGMDIQSRTSMGDLVPATAFGNSTLSDKQLGREMASLVGAAGGLGEKFYDAAQLAFAKGEYWQGLKTALPRSLTSAVTGVEMAITGQSKDSKGRVMFDATGGEAFIKGFDGNTYRQAELSRTQGLEYKDKAILTYMTNEFRRQWIEYAQKRDEAGIERIEREIEKWNNSRPRYTVDFDRDHAYQSANKNEMTWGERDKIPKRLEWWEKERPEM